MNSSRAGWVLAGANAAAFVALRALRTPEYEKLRARDEEFNAGGPITMSSADPIHLAGRPFYSSAHTYVPMAEDLYFMANFPAEAAMLSVGFPLSSATHEWWTGSVRTSGAWQSWTLALVFGTASALWGYAIGAVGSRWLGRFKDAA